MTGSDPSAVVDGHSPCVVDASVVEVGVEVELFALLHVHPVDSRYGGGPVENNDLGLARVAEPLLIGDGRGNDVATFAAIAPDDAARRREALWDSLGSSSGFVVAAGQGRVIWRPLSFPVAVHT